MKEFEMTKNLFVNRISVFGVDGTPLSLSYMGWLDLPDDMKAAALFVNFYDTIIMAWKSAKLFGSDEFEAVETVLQYLMKNVPIIKKYSKRYVAGYIYRVAYNCLFNLCHNRKRDKVNRECRVDYLVEGENGTVNITYYISDPLSEQGYQDVIDNYPELCETFWDLVENADVDATTLIEYMLESRRYLPRGIERRKEEIIQSMKSALSKHPEIINYFYK